MENWVRVKYFALNLNLTLHTGFLPAGSPLGEAEGRQALP
jgi:hypothetical protein